MPDLTSIAAVAATLQTLFSEEAVQLAHQTSLVRRHSKLSGPLILLILVAGFIQHPTASYNILAQVAYDYGVVVTRQAIQQRLTPGAIMFFRLLLDRSLQLLQARCCLPIPLLTQFSAVYLLDSSQVALPAALISRYPGPGTGGDGPQAGIKWQVLWEMLSGNLMQVLGQPAKQSDHQYHGYSDVIGPSRGSGGGDSLGSDGGDSGGSLMLFDLGYVALPRLQQLDTQHIYFICRWNPRFEAFTAQGHPFDLRVYLAQCARCGFRQVELNSRVGVRAQMSVRVVAFRLPTEICEQRRRRARQTERKRGFSYTAHYKAMLEWNVYVTNVPAERLAADQVSRAYRLRWQVELLFKLWKMQGALDEVAGRKEGRAMCELYANLIGMAVFGYLSAPVRLIDEGEGIEKLRELSPSRAWQVWQRQIEKIGRALNEGSGEELTRMLRQVYRLWEQFGRKDERKNRLTSLGQLQAETVASETSEAQALPVLPAIVTTTPKKRIRRGKQDKQERLVA